uniref:Uncharacterized protein n=1 Tax=Schistocephalus solidus TaxID=70667 RepID=A0A183TJ57_SCHSO
LKRNRKVSEVMVDEIYDRLSKIETVLHIAGESPVPPKSNPRKSPAKPTLPVQPPQSSKSPKLINSIQEQTSSPSKGPPKTPSKTRSVAHPLNVATSQTPKKNDASLASRPSTAADCATLPLKAKPTAVTPKANLEHLGMIIDSVVAGLDDYSASLYTPNDYVIEPPRASVNEVTVREFGEFEAALRQEKNRRSSKRLPPPVDVDETGDASPTDLFSQSQEVSGEPIRRKKKSKALSETRFSEQGQLDGVGADFTFFWSGWPKEERRAAGVAFSIRNDILDWFDKNDADISKLLAQKNGLHKAYMDLRTDATNAAFFRCWHLVQQRLREMQDAWMIRKAEEIQGYADRNEMKNFFKAIKVSYGPCFKGTAPLLNSDGITLLKE